MKKMEKRKKMRGIKPIFFENHTKLIELIPTIQKHAMEGLQKEFKRYIYDEEQMLIVFKLLRQVISMVQKKWMIEICFTLLIYGNPNYNTIRRVLPDISSRTLTDRLRSLEKSGIILREVSTEGQLRVYYSLTTFGMEELFLLTPAFLNFLIPPRLKKNYPSFDSFHKYIQTDMDKKE